TVTQLAAGLARHSRHPVSEAIARLSDSQIQVQHWDEVRGSGVRGVVTLEGNRTATALLGSVKWLKECGVDLAPGQNFIREWSSQGATIVGLAIEGLLAGLFAVRDTVKPGARQMMQQLHDQGLKTFLITGDTA